MDPYNGLLLNVSYDAGFDAGLISFADDGMILISPRAELAHFEAIGISPFARIEVKDATKAYLRDHRSSHGYPEKVESGSAPPNPKA
jgi:hypothetical protein